MSQRSYQEFDQPAERGPAERLPPDLATSPRPVAFGFHPDLESDHQAPVGSSNGRTIDAGILAIAAGDRTYFTEMFRHLAPRAKAYLIERGVAVSVADELAIQAMTEVWRTAKSFDPSAQSGEAWIFQRVRRISQRNGVSLR